MSKDYSNLLNPGCARIFRILHRDNLDWVLDHGLHCGNSAVRAERWTSIGNQELIDKRSTWPVRAQPGGVLNDYVPFYFTPFSVMMRNISTGWHGVVRYPNADILILVSSLRRVAELGLTFLFTDGHANHETVSYYNDLRDLGVLDWKSLQARDFQRDPDDPKKFLRYQAEALIHRYCPLEGLSGIVCYDGKAEITLQHAMTARSLQIPVAKRPGWYFQ